MSFACVGVGDSVCGGILALVYRCSYCCCGDGRADVGVAVVTMLLFVVFVVVEFLVVAFLLLLSSLLLLLLW